MRHAAVVGPFAEHGVHAWRVPNGDNSTLAFVLVESSSLSSTNIIALATAIFIIVAVRGATFIVVCGRRWTEIIVIVPIEGCVFRANSLALDVVVRSRSSSRMAPLVQMSLRQEHHHPTAIRQIIFWRVIHRMRMNFYNNPICYMIHQRQTL